MSGGAVAQSGFVYQQDYAAFRILGSEAKRLLIPDAGAECIASFKIEGRETSEGPAWDVSWMLEGGSLQLRECKDTEISRDDRRTFYRRVRSEIANGTDSSNLQFGWVTDPGKQSGNILRHLTGMSQISQSARAVSSKRLPAQVNDARTALEEALYYLCHEENASAPAVTEDVARALLARLSIDRFPANELADSVERIAPTVFGNGLGRTIRELIQGQLSTTIQRDGVAAYTRTDFLDAVGSGQLVLGLAGSLREILTCCSAASKSPVVSGIEWSCRPDRPAKIWTVEERIENWDEGQSCVLAAPTGVGKSTTSQQMFAARAEFMNPHHVLHIEAASVANDVVELLPQLCSMLCGVSSTWLAIDGLDQIETSMKPTWRQSIIRLLRLPKLTVVVTTRREVLLAQDWMQELLSSLPEIPLQELSTEQITTEFQDVGLPAPQNQALLSCLKNPFLFSIYARTVSDADMPLTDRGEVSAFDVIEEYWRRRVTAESQGARAAGGLHGSATAKRAAVSYLADCTLAGDLTSRRPTDNPLVAEGIETLCREGVLVPLTTNTVTWSHTWLREYAAAESLLERLTGTRSAISLAQAVCGVTTDHAARNAAIGGCKWIVSHPELGHVEDYVAELYQGNTAAAREVLTVLLEDAPTHMQIAKLPPVVIIEALALARVMKARQWLDQVAALPDTLFATVQGSDLQVAVLQFESEMLGDD